MQECFIKLCNNLSVLQDDEAIFSLLRTYAFNVMINYNKNEANHFFREVSYNETLFQNAFGDEEISIAEEKLKQIWNTVDQLTEKRRYIYLLKKHFGYTNAQIAAKLNVTVKAIEKHRTETNRTLREKLSQQ